MPLTRMSAYTSASFDLTDDLELYAQGIYGDYTVNTQLAPVPLQGVVMPASNPYIPSDLKLLLDSRPEPERPIRVRREVDRERSARAGEQLRHVLTDGRCARPPGRRLDVRLLCAVRSEQPMETPDRQRQPDEGGGTGLCARTAVHPSAGALARSASIPCCRPAQPISPLTRESMPTSSR